MYTAIECSNLKLLLAHSGVGAGDAGPAGDAAVSPSKCFLDKFMQNLGQFGQFG